MLPLLGCRPTPDFPEAHICRGANIPTLHLGLDPRKRQDDTLQNTSGQNFHGDVIGYHKQSSTQGAATKTTKSRLLRKSSVSIAASKS